MIVLSRTLFASAVSSSRGHSQMRHAEIQDCSYNAGMHDAVDFWTVLHYAEFKHASTKNSVH